MTSNRQMTSDTQLSKDRQVLASKPWPTKALQSTMTKAVYRSAAELRRVLQSLLEVLLEVLPVDLAC